MDEQTTDVELAARIRLAATRCETPTWEIEVVLEAAQVPQLMAERERLVVGLRSLRQVEHCHLEDGCPLCEAVNVVLLPAQVGSDG